MPKTQIEIAVKGVDNASKVLQDVRGQLDGLNRKVVEAGQVGKQATSVVSAGFSALSGSITGAVSGARGMASAIQAMGVAMNTAMPIAAAVSAALFAIKKAYDAIQSAREERIRQIQQETEAEIRKAKAVEQLYDKYRKVEQHQRKLADLEAEIAGVGADPLQRKQREADAAQKSLENMIASKSAIKAEQARLGAEIDRLVKEAEERWSQTYLEGTAEQYTREEYVLSKKERQARWDAADKLNEERKKLSEKYNQLLDDEEVQRLVVKKTSRELELLGEQTEKARRELVEGIRQQAQAQLEALAQRRDAEIEAFNKSSFARSVSQATFGARSVSMEEVAKVAALQAAGFVRSSATGYTTSQGDAMREAEARAKTERYQDEMLALVRAMEQKAGVQAGGLNIDVMSF